MFKSQTTIYFKTQDRPELTKEFLNNNCQLPEVFLKTNLGSNDTVFNKSKVWISIVHFIEPFLKLKKDRVISFIYRFTYKIRFK